MKGSRLLAFSLLAFAPPLVAQASVTREAPLRFAVAWAGGSPRGELAEVAEAPEGFVAWLSLPFDRGAAIGLRAEFSVLAFPEQQVSRDVAPDAVLDLTVRGTIGFTGVGPRLELRAGPVAVSGAILAGYTRVITDITGVVTDGTGVNSVAVSESEYALATKLSLDGYLPLYRGVRGTGLVATGGVDYTTAGRTALPRRDAFGLDTEGRLVLDRPAVAPTLLVVRAGMSLEF